MDRKKKGRSRRPSGAEMKQNGHRKRTATAVLAQNVFGGELPPGALPDNFFREDARKRVEAELDAFGFDKPPIVVVKLSPEEHLRQVMEMPLPGYEKVPDGFDGIKYAPKSGRGRRIDGETARLIKTEAFRRLTASGSQRQMSARFFLDKTVTERYDRYRAVVAQHGERIQEFLSILQK